MRRPRRKLLVWLLNAGALLIVAQLLPGIEVKSFVAALGAAVLLGLLGWLPVHHLLRDWLYGGDVWHPLLMDLSLFILAVSGALWILLHG